MFALICLLPSTFAAQAAGYEFKCSNRTVADSKYFADLQAEARALNESFCRVLKATPVPDALPRTELQSLAASTRRIVTERVGPALGADLQEQLRYFEQQLTAGDAHPPKTPIFIRQPGPTPDRPATYFFEDFDKWLVVAPDKTCGAAVQNAPCQAVLADLALAIEPYAINYDAYTTGKNGVLLDQMLKRWDKYFDEGRAMTAVDLFFTTWQESEHLQQPHLVGPPPRQWFLLHPEAIASYVKRGPDGEEAEPGLALEWIGVNFWEKSWIGVPIGISLTSIVVDSAAVPDVGHGVTLHFDNTYSVGWARHGEEDVVYLSANVLNLLEDKRTQAEKYWKALKEED